MPAKEPVTRFGLQIPNFTYPGVPDAELFDRVVDIARTAEASGGFDSVWVMDHFYQLPMLGPPSNAMFEAYTLLGAIAARTDRVRLGTMVTGVTYRHPAVLAKVVTALDVISKGRAILGIGAAWFEQEHRGLGVEFPPTGERLGRLEEAVQICRLMFTEEQPSFEGRYYRIEQALNVPRPITPGGPPILIGGSGEKRTLRYVARYADACNVFGDPPAIKRLMDVLDAHCEREGRDPSAITRTALCTMIVAPTAAEAEPMLEAMPEAIRPRIIGGGPDQVAEQVQSYWDAGLDGIVVNMPTVSDLGPIQLAGEILAGLR